MKILLITLQTLLLILLLSGCTPATNNNSNKTKSAPETNSADSLASKFQFSDYKIMKGQLGPIKIGMTLSEAEKHFEGLTKKENEATCFGFGGGGSAFEYYLGDEMVFSLIPTRDTDTLLLIIAVHNNLSTANGLHPKASVSELLEKYPDLMVNQDLMNGWEFFKDTTNNWDFVFKTDEATEIGEYPEIEIPSKPKRMTFQSDCIVIR